MPQFRLLKSADAASYFGLRLAAEREFPEYVGMSAERELIAGAERMAALLENYAAEGIAAFGAFENERLIGIGCASRKLSPKYRHKVFVWGMYVDPEFRRQKIGRFLIAEITSWARQQDGIRAVQLQVTTTNEPARALYERVGFSVYGTEKDSLFAANKFHSVHLMELALTGAC